MADRINIADPGVREETIESVTDVLAGGQLAAGEEVERFEAEFAEFCGVDHGVATTNGTTALHAALEALGVEPGERVLTTPFSFVATANAIRFAGGIPEFVDVDPETFNLDPHAVEDRIRSSDESVAAILAVHLYGLSADMAHLRDIADTYDVALVEDAAQAHGATFEGDRVGSFGDAAAFSFYPTKNMTTGEGGMVTTDDQSVADAAARFIDHGRGRETYEHVELGHNFRMTDMAAAIGRHQLDRLQSFNAERRQNAIRLDRWLSDTPLVTPREPEDRRHVYHQYTVRCGNRDEVRRQLDERGIGASVYYPTPIHRLEAYEAIDAETPVADRLADEVLSLPIHPGLTSADVDRIGLALTEEVAIDHV